jgi:hypothetical protein
LQADAARVNELLLVLVVEAVTSSSLTASLVPNLSRSFGWQDYGELLRAELQRFDSVP